MIECDYKFYLSFQYGICLGYATERISTLFEMFIIPVVLGGHNYTDILPPNSFIDVCDFSLSTHLAEYVLNIKK